MDLNGLGPEGRRIYPVALRACSATVLEFIGLFSGTLPQNMFLKNTSPQGELPRFLFCLRLLIVLTSDKCRPFPVDFRFILRASPPAAGPLTHFASHIPPRAFPKVYMALRSLTKLFFR